eukprot:6470732-Ditylum_brightwellii.AAC.1
MPSGKAVHQEASIQVSTNQDELILTLPMSHFLAQCDCAFEVLVKEPKSFDQNMHPYLKTILKYHPRSVACMVSTSKMKGCNAMSGFTYEQRIPLPKKVRHQFVAERDGDFYPRGIHVVPRNDEDSCGNLPSPKWRSYY